MNRLENRIDGKDVAVVLCGGKSERFGRDKMSMRVFGKSISRMSVEKFCDFSEIIVVLPLEKLRIFRCLQSDYKLETQTKNPITTLSQPQKTEMEELFLESFDFPHVRYEKYRWLFEGEGSEIPDGREIFWELYELMLLAEKYEIKFINGGATRTESVLNALLQTERETGVVAIHDGARPFVSALQIKKATESAVAFGSGVVCVQVRDTLRKFSGQSLLAGVDRNLLQVQTPQAFDIAKLNMAYQSETAKCGDFTDDSLLFSQVHGETRFVLGSISNFKITYPQDLEGLTQKCGFGYDVHQLAEGKKFILGGVSFDFPKGMVAHSDGDVLIHAICDAILSAAGKKDIGHQFPDTASEYCNIDSKILLAKCVEIAKSEHLKVHNISTMIMAEKPKIAPKIDEMKTVLAKILEIAESQISISATTTETLGIVGEGKGVACCAMVLLG